MNAQYESSPPPPGAPHEPGWQPADPAGAPTGNGSPGAALRDAIGKLGEVQAFAGHYLAAKIDGIKLSIRNLGIFAALGIVGLIALGAVVNTTIVLLLLGIAGAWGALLGGRWWLGALITGVLVLALIAIGVIIGMKMLTKSFRAKTVEKYEQRKGQERARYGHDVDQYAAPRREA
jgi:Zn-dependent protease with chaperone function